MTSTLRSTPGTTLTGVRLVLARLAWLVTTGLCLLMLAVIVPRHPPSLLFDPLIEDSYQLLYSLMNYRSYLRYILFLRLLVALVFILIGAYIFWRKSDDWLALVTSFSMVCLPYMILFGGFIYSLNFSPPWNFWLDIADGLVTVLGILSIPLLLLLFPDGHIEPKRLAKPVKGLFMLLLMAVLFPQNLLSVPSRFLEIAWTIVFFCFVLFIGLGIFGQVYRYFLVSSPSQRQQTKWIIFSLVVNLLWWIFIRLRPFGIGELRFTAGSIYGLFELHATLLIVLLIPVSLANSVLRHHLYDIDLIIRRTLVYSVLSLVLVSIYAASVLVSQKFLTGLIGRETPLVLVSSTLLVAGLFSPLRARIQLGIDRRFFRSRYDVEKILASFSNVTRYETDLDTLHVRLLWVVQETMQPESLQIWLKTTAPD
jgi:hypothetical protein